MVDAAAQAPFPDDRSLTIRVEGMHCASCVRRLETALAGVDGVSRAEVQLVPGTARVTGRGRPDPAPLLKAVAEAGFAGAVDTRGVSGELASLAAEERDLRRDTRVAAALTVPVVILAMGAHLSPAFHGWVQAVLGALGNHLIQFALTTAVLAGPGRRFFVTGVPLLFRGAPDMNTLAALGTSAAWGYSTLVTFAPGLFPVAARAVYFEAAAVIVTLILFGRMLEARAKGQSGAAIAALLDLVPPMAVRLSDAGPETVPVSALTPGDRIQVRPGAAVPADGVVLSGESRLDEAMLTGEPLPVAKGPGDAVTGGTLNGPGALTVSVRAVGAAATVGRIAALVGEAQAGKLPIQAAIDRVTAWFVPAVMGIALLAAALWLALGPAPALPQALVAAASVLIIACPCAMGLATPVSIRVALGRGARSGLLIRRGAALERMATVDLVAFDKTGTLTEGAPRLTDTLPAPGMPAEAVLRDAAALAAQSDHPVARAIAAAAPGPAVPAEGVRDHPGEGVVGRVAGRRLALGNRRLMARLSIPVDGLETRADALADAGKTPVFLASEGALLGVLAVADRVRPGAAATIAALRDQGVAVALISGDRQATAEAVAGTLGIDRVVAEVLPEGKLSVIDALRAEGRRVAFVGDGINDAPALAGADVGIAIGAGSDIAIESADIVLPANDPAAVVDALALARATMANIRQNLFWAFGYNVALIPVAAGLLWPLTGWMLSPMLAAGAMACSSLFVVGNALRLGRVRLRGRA